MKVKNNKVDKRECPAAAEKIEGSDEIDLRNMVDAMYLKYHFIALIHPIQWTIAKPVGADRPAKRQKKTSCVTTGWPVRSTVHSPGASYFLPVLAT